MIRVFLRPLSDDFATVYTIYSVSDTPLYSDAMRADMHTVKLSEDVPLTSAYYVFYSDRLPLSTRQLTTRAEQRLFTGIANARLDPEYHVFATQIYQTPGDFPAITIPSSLSACVTNRVTLRAVFDDRHEDLFITVLVLRSVWAASQNPTAKRTLTISQGFDAAGHPTKITTYLL